MPQALGKNSEGGGGGTGTVTAVKIASNPDVFIDPVDGIIDMSSYAANWNDAYNKRHTHSNKSVLDGITSAKVTSWDNVAKIMEDDADAIINKWDEIIDFLDGIPDQSTLAEILAAKANTSTTVTSVSYASKKLQKTINGTTTDIVTASTLFSDGLPTNTTKNYVLAAPSNAAGTPTFRALVAADLPSLYIGKTQVQSTSANQAMTGITSIDALAYFDMTNSRVGIGTSSPSYKLHVNGYTSTTRLYLSSDVYLEYDSTNGGIHVVGAGLYSDSYVSALGSNSEGGGSSTFDEDMMWAALQSTSGTYATTKIATAHIPDMASTYGYLKSSALNGYATQSWVNQQGFVTSSGVTSVAMTVPTGLAISGSPITTTGTLALTFASGYSIPTTAKQSNWDAAFGWGNHADEGYLKGNQTITLSGDVSGSGATSISVTIGQGKVTNAMLAGSIANGKLLNSSVTVNGTSVSLGGSITTEKWGTARNITIKDADSTNSGTAVSVNGSAAVTLLLPSTIKASLTGNASTATTLQTERNIWGQSFNGSADVKDTIFMLSSEVTTVNTNSAKIKFNSYNTNDTLRSPYIQAIHYGSYSRKRLSVFQSNAQNYTDDFVEVFTIYPTGQVYIPSTGSFKIGDCTITWDSTNNMLKFDTGIYSTGAVSALGSNSSGGGSGTFDEEAMWVALGTTVSAKVIASSHIPNLAASKITSGTLAAARIPIATASAVGGIKVGTTLAISDGVLNQKSGIATAGTYRSVTVDTYGRVTAGTNPTTLSGYGVLDDANGRYYALNGGTALTATSSSHYDLNSLTTAGSYYCSGNTTSAYFNNMPSTINHAFRIWVSLPSGSGNYRRQRFQYYDQQTIYERYYNGSDWGGWQIVQRDLSLYALASSLDDYLPLSGGTLTGGLAVGGTLYTKGFAHMIKFDVDTSRAFGYGWWDTNSNTVASIVYHNTAQNIILNPIGSANTYSDAVGKYSLIVGNNKLTYNTYPILHSNNFDSYALPLTGGTLTGTLAWKNSTALPKTTTPQFMLTMDKFADGGTTRYANLEDVIVGKASALENLYNQSTRPTSANLTHITNGGVQHFKATSSMTEGKPSGDGHILHFHWDGAAYDAQLSISTGRPPWMQLRSSHPSDGWTDWITVLTSNNYNSYSPTLTGTGASGTWGISVSGNAATATKATQDGDGRTITSTYLTAIGRSGDNITQSKGGTTSNVTHILERSETVNFTPNAVGWYRVAQFINTAAHGNSVLLYLNRTYANGNNESYIFAITTMYGGSVSISQLAGKYNSRNFTKIRVDNPNSGTGYIDVYYGSEKENATHVTTIGSAYSLSSVTFNPTTVGTLTEFNILSSGMKTDGEFYLSKASQGTMRFVPQGGVNYIQSANDSFGAAADLVVSGPSLAQGSNLINYFDTVTIGQSTAASFGLSVYNTKQRWALHTHTLYNSVRTSFYASYGGGQAMWVGSSSTSSSHYLFAAYKGITGESSGGSAVMFVRADGCVGIDTSSPSYALHVVGTIYGSGEITAASDARAKNILGNVNLDLKYMADAPNILYEWKNKEQHDDNIHVGSLAQYWLKDEKAKYLVSQGKDNGEYSLNYGALATSMAISIAKEVVKHDDEITRLKKVVAKQAKEIVDLKSKVRELEERRVA